MRFKARHFDGVPQLEDNPQISELKRVRLPIVHIPVGYFTLGHANNHHTTKL